MRLLHMSDLHFGYADPRAIDALRRSVVSLAPERVVITGDLTQRARPSQFAEAAAFVDSLGIPVTLIPGNHDLPLENWARRLLFPRKAFHAAFRTRAGSHAVEQGYELVGFDTTRVYLPVGGALDPRAVPDMTPGRVVGGAKHWRIALLHHPPLVPEGIAPERALRDGIEALDALGLRGIDVVLCGHVHIASVLVAPAGSPAAARRVLTINAGSATCERNPPHEHSFVLIEDCADGLSIAPYRFVEEADAFHRAPGWTATLDREACWQVEPEGTRASITASPASLTA
ncbi:MAG: metallophosphoesterase family protein [Proteobacteria bacterium]|nr:metallophosphoesterase family protein [Burkholderiales bacterium]